MNWITSLLRKNKQTNDTETFVFRQGKHILADETFNAWTSGDLDKMLKASELDTNPIDRHFLLQSIVTETYKLRKEEKYRDLCIEYAEKHLEEFDKIATALKEDMDGVLPRVTTFQNYSTLLSELGDYERAISVCEVAISYGLADGTKSGFQGRIERIKKKIISNK